MGLCCWFNWFASYWRVYLAIFIIQGCLGVFLFERFAWKAVERLRKGEQELFDQFPSFKNRDAHKWTRAYFYPGAFCMLIFRASWILCWLWTLGAI